MLNSLFILAHPPLASPSFLYFIFLIILLLPLFLFYDCRSHFLHCFLSHFLVFSVVSYYILIFFCLRFCAPYTSLIFILWFPLLLTSFTDLKDLSFSHFTSFASLLLVLFSSLLLQTLLIIVLFLHYYLMSYVSKIVGLHVPCNWYIYIYIYKSLSNKCNFLVINLFFTLVSLPRVWCG
jgi:hypothetical protein